MAALQQTFYIDTRDMDELAGEFSRLFGPATLDSSSRYADFHCQFTYIALGDVGIVHGKYASDMKIQFPDFNVFAGSPAPLQGAGAHRIRGRDVSVSADHGVVVSPGTTTLHFGAGFEHISLTVQAAALTGKLAAVVGDLRLGPLEFNPIADLNRPQSLQLSRLLQFVTTEAELSWPIPPIMLAEMQQAMMTSFLLANTSNYSGLLHREPAMAAPRQVRLAEQFIEAHWDQPITIEALVAASNVSARSLYMAFRKGRGYTPMEFAKRVRLGHARRMLSAPQPRTSVAAVAFECGFGNPGHFSRDYLNQFGENPSETLRRGRG